nr:putative RNA-directed DNA polymerase, eukaryota, reverse transcriptase zinc-binding domain protein [Tanacetum cinerariifolium]
SGGNLLGTDEGVPTSLGGNEEPFGGSTTVNKDVEQPGLVDASDAPSHRNQVTLKVLKDLVCAVCLLLHDLIMNHGFFDAGERNNHRKKTTMNTDTCLALGSDGILNDVTHRVDAVMKVVSPSVVEETVAMECPAMNTPGVGPNPPPSTHKANASAGNAPGKPFYANATTGNPSRKKVNVHTLYTLGGIGIDLVVLVDSIRAISERFANTAYVSFLRKKVAYPVVTNYFIRNNPLSLKKWHPDENLLKEDVSTVPVWVKLYGVPVTAFSKDGLSVIFTKLVMPKLTREGHYTCNVRFEYEWKPSMCSSCKVFRHIHEECPKNTGAGEKKTVKKPSQTFQVVIRKKGVEPTIEVSNSNPFDVLNLVENDVEFGTNGGTTNLVSNGATSSGSSFMNINNDGEFASNTHVVPTGIMESDSEMEVVFDETANLRISTSGKDGSDKGYGTNSLLEQWRDSYPDSDDYDPYDDYMYENHDLSKHLQSICYDLDITNEKLVTFVTSLSAAANTKEEDTHGDANHATIEPGVLAMCLTTMNSEFVQGVNVAIPLAAVEEVSQRNLLCSRMGSSFSNLLLGRDTITSAPIWVKLHHVPIVAFFEIGLSLITSQLGRPVMLDAYTSPMCQKSWGRNSYARALMKVSSLAALKESLVVAIPFPNGTGHSLVEPGVNEHGDLICKDGNTRKAVCQVNFKNNDTTAVVNNIAATSQNDALNKNESVIYVSGHNECTYGVLSTDEQDTPANDVSTSAMKNMNMTQNVLKNEKLVTFVTSLSAAANTKEEDTHGDANHATIEPGVLGPRDAERLKNVKVVDSTLVEDEDGFTQVKRKNGKGKQDGKAKQVPGIHLTNHKPKLVYHEAKKPPTNNNDKATTSDSSVRKDNQPTMQPKDGNIVFLRNSFESLMVKDKALDTDDTPPHVKTYCLNVAAKDSLEDVLDDYDDEVEEVYIEDNGRHTKQNKGASTPSDQLIRKNCFALSFMLIIDISKGVICEITLLLIKKLHSDRSWCILGDFNVSLSADEKSTGPPYIDTGMRDFQDYVEAIEVSDVNSMGLRFTWNQKPKGKHGTLKKIDRIMANLDFYSSFVGSSDRLKKLKKPLRKLLYDLRNLHENVKKLPHELDKGVTSQLNCTDLFCNKLTSDVANYMVRDVSDQEIREAMFVMGDNKAPGPDGYTAAFFKEAWEILATNVTKAIKEFFTNGVLFKELNHTILALILKVTSPMKINDYSPISCFNILYKCISRIISNRMKGSLADLVSLNQSTFVLGRRIYDNILLTQELMHNYHLDRGTLRCAFKVDSQKAYDTVYWKFLYDLLVGFGFHPRIIGWIMECVTSTSFSLTINGSLHGYFKGK